MAIQCRRKKKKTTFLLNFITCFLKAVADKGDLFLDSFSRIKRCFPLGNRKRKRNVYTKIINKQTSKHFKLREFPFSKHILQNISHKVNIRGVWNKNVLGRKFQGGKWGTSIRLPNSNYFYVTRYRSLQRTRSTPFEILDKFQ